ncbi:unnamed protein product [Zymoseptoria tritici ST99CH_3D7]|uniref:ACB domain-containing protein n=1 Tax=Zymoseptoria tritici (strain ST99CH_3D7) TaxID=1276538 RepID=A0A1X7RU22_ZYMT9|nr:unnamed protein product [Zymoseptoria tritici ST99CH_3D7]
MSAEFKKAAEDSKKLKTTPSNDQLLELYALYKVGNGEDFEKAAKPGVFDMKGKYKYNAWKKEVDEDKGTSSNKSGRTEATELFLHIPQTSIKIKHFANIEHRE